MGYNSARLKFLCNSDDKATWEQAAQEQGLTLSAWVRQTLNRIARGAPFTDQRQAEPRAPRSLEVALPPGVVRADELPVVRGRLSHADPINQGGPTYPYGGTSE